MLALALAACSAPNRPIYSGTIQNDAAAIGGTTGGRIATIRVASGDRVRRGALIVTFEDDAERASLAGAVAAERRARAQEALLRAGARTTDLERAAAAEAEAQARGSHSHAVDLAQLATAQGAVRNARATLDHANAAAALAATELARATTLVAGGDLARSALDRAVADDREARAQVAVARAALAAALRVEAHTSAAVPADLAANSAAVVQARESHATLAEGARPEELAAAAAATRDAAAATRAARARLDQMRVLAPNDGVIEDLNLHPGDLVAPATPIASLVPDADPYIRVFVPQSRLGAFRLGAAVRVRSDALPGETFAGTVTQIDTRAQFTPRNVQTAEDRADVTFGVKVAISDPQRKLRSGTTGEVEP